VKMKLSKSRFVAGCQCLRRLYWQVHEPELAMIGFRLSSKLKLALCHCFFSAVFLSMNESPVVLGEFQ
jgi:hypothetical protein